MNFNRDYSVYADVVWRIKIVVWRLLLLMTAKLLRDTVAVEGLVGLTLRG